MLSVLNILRFVFPFVCLGMFFLLYQSKGKRMRRFYCTMALTLNGRRFFTLMLYLVLLFFSWCSHVCSPNLFTLLTGAFVLPLVFYRWSNCVLRTLHDHKCLFYFGLLVAIICIAVPAMNSVAVTLFVLTLASAFYPSLKVIELRESLHRKKEETKEDFRERVVREVMEKYY